MCGDGAKRDEHVPLTLQRVGRNLSSIYLVGSLLTLTRSCGGIPRPLRWPPWASLAGDLFLETFSNPHAKRPIF